jgi:hypothetical protein
MNENLIPELAAIFVAGCAMIITPEVWTRQYKDLSPTGRILAKIHGVLIAALVILSGILVK